MQVTPFLTIPAFLWKKCSKTIIAPKKWINQEVSVNLYPEEWILI